MSISQPELKKLSRMPARDRRAAQQGVRARLSRYWGIIFRRPLAISWIDWQPRVAFLDRRSASDVFPVYSELTARLKAYQKVHSARKLRELRVVCKELSRTHWAGVNELPCQLLVKATEQAIRLRGRRSSHFLEVLILRLRESCLSAARREERELRTSKLAGLKGISVSYGSYDEFEEVKRQWSKRTA